MSDARGHNSDAAAIGAPDAIRRGFVVRLWRRVRTPWGLAVVLSLLAIGSFVALDPTSALSMLLFNAGTVCFTLGWWRRPEPGLFCAKCGYQVAPSGPPSANCPECGSDWGRPGGTRDFRLVRRPGLLVFGLVVMVAYGALGHRLQPILRSQITRFSPSYLLVRHIERDGSSLTPDAWAELQQRTMSVEHTGRLYRALLKELESGSSLASPVATWLEDAIADGMGTPQERAAYFTAQFNPDVHAPGSVRVGRAFYPLLLDSDAGFRPGVFSAYAYVAGRHGGDDAPWHRSSKVHSTLGPQRIDDVPIRATEPGTIEVQLAVWIIVTPAGPPVPPEWQEDGEPRIPPTAVWWRRYDLSQTVEVLEGP